MSQEIKRISLTPTPPTPKPPRGEGSKTQVLSFDRGALSSAKQLLKDRGVQLETIIEIRRDPNSLAENLVPVLDNCLQENLINIPASQLIGTKEKELSQDILDHMMPKFLEDPENFTKDLLKSLEKKQLPEFVKNAGNDLAFSEKSWKALLEDRSTLKAVLNAVNETFKTVDGSESDKELLKPIVNNIKDIPHNNNLLVNKFTVGTGVSALAVIGLLQTPLDELAVNKYKELTSGTPNPEQVLSGDAMKMISEFKAVDVSQETQKVIQKRITVNLNLAREKLPSLTLTPTAYYKDTLKPFSINSQQKGVQVQADVKTQINEHGDGKPSAIIYQEGKTSIQITVIPIEAPRALPLKQSTDDITVITIPAGGTPLVKTEKADFNTLLQTP